MQKARMTKAEKLAMAEAARPKGAAQVQAAIRLRRAANWKARQPVKTVFRGWHGQIRGYMV